MLDPLKRGRIIDHHRNVIGSSGKNCSQYKSDRQTQFDRRDLVFFGKVTSPTVAGEVMALGVRGLVDGVSKYTENAFTLAGGSGACLLSPRTFGRLNFCLLSFFLRPGQGTHVSFLFKHHDAPSNPPQTVF